MNYQAKKCLFCQKDLLSNLMILQHSQCSCVFHQECLTKFIAESQPENLNVCPQCAQPHPFKIKTLKVHFQAELINNKKEQLNVDQISKEYEQQIQFIQDRTQAIEQNIYLLSENTNKQNKEIQQYQTESEIILKKIGSFQNLENCPQKYRQLRDKLDEKVEEYNMLYEEKNLYENIYKSYYNDDEIDYKSVLQNNMDRDKREEINNNKKKIQELRALLKKQNFENIGRQIIKTNFQFPPLNEEQQSFINKQN